MEDDNRIELETNLRSTIANGVHYVGLKSLAIALGELYEKGIAMGWETKILDPLNDELRKIHNHP